MISAAVQAMEVESMPPLRVIPIGVMPRILLSTDSLKTVRKCSTYSSSVSYSITSQGLGCQYRSLLTPLTSTDIRPAGAIWFMPW